MTETTARAGDQNTILLSLPDRERGTVLSRARLIQMPKHTVLSEAGEPIRAAYFINNGLVSILTVMTDGKTVEVGLIGKEGFVGLPLSADRRTSPTRFITVVVGGAFEIDAQAFSVALARCPTLATRLLGYSQELALQATQFAACNRLHSVDGRLARWLLKCQDRLGGDRISVAQMFLAGMQGTRRAGISVALGVLQKAGLIAYQRGEVTITNRRKLEAAACECYQTLSQQLRAWRVEEEETAQALP